MNGSTGGAFPRRALGTGSPLAWGDEKARFRESWRTNCQCLAEYDEVVAARDAEIEELKRQLHSLSVLSEPHPPITHETDYHETRLVEEEGDQHALLTPYTCATSFPDCGYGHYGSAKDQ